MFKKLRRKKKKVVAPPPTEPMFNTLKTLGLSPTHVIDIGCNKGIWSRAARRAFPDAQITAFEPQTELAEMHQDLVADPKFTLHYKGVGDFDGTATFTLHDRDDSSSFSYSEEEAADEGFSQIAMEICKLDTVITSSNHPTPEIVKIDAEGFDLRVIDGAKNTLSKTDVVLIEAAIANPRFENTLLAIAQRMDELGFRLFDITDLNRTPERGVLWLIECVFVRNGGMLDQESRTGYI